MIVAIIHGHQNMVLTYTEIIINVILVTIKATGLIIAPRNFKATPFNLLYNMN